MAAKAVKQWHRVVALLEDSSQAGDVAQPRAQRAAETAADKLDAFFDQPVQPRAVVKKLMQEKIPLEVCRAVSLLVAAHDDAKTLLAVKAAATLLEVATESGVKAPAHSSTSPNGTASSSTSSSSGSLLVLLRQQLSGLLPLLPGMVERVAARLRAAAGATLHKSETVNAIGAAVEMYQMLESLSCIWPRCITSTTAHGAVLPVADLFSATLQYLSSCMNMAEPHTQPGFEDLMMLAVATATRFLGMITKDVFDASVELEALQAVWHPDFLFFLCFNIAMFMLVPRVQQANSQAADGGSSSGGAGEPDKVPEPVMQLLKLVGCQHPVLALAIAGRCKLVWRVEAFTPTDLLSPLVQALERFESHVADEKQQYQHTEQSQLQLGWLAASLLHWTAQLDSNSSSNHPELYWVACRGANVALSCTLCCSQELALQHASFKWPAAISHTALQSVLQLLPGLTKAWREQQGALLAARGAPADAICSDAAGGTSDAASDSSGSSGGAASDSSGGAASDSSGPINAQYLGNAAVDAADVLMWLLRADLPLLPPLMYSAATVCKLFAVLQDMSRTNLAGAAACAAAAEAGGDEGMAGGMCEDAKLSFHLEYFHTLLEPRALGKHSGFFNTNRKHSELFNTNRSLLAIWEEAEGGTGTAADTSAAAKQMFGLLCSMLKVNSVSNNLANTQFADELEPFGLVWCRVVCGAASTLLTKHHTTPAAAEAAGQQHDVAALPPAASHASTLGLPWVVVLGRCCLQLSAFLRVVPQPAQEGEGEAAGASAAGAAVSLTAAQRMQVVAQWAAAVDGLQSAVGEWAERDSTVDRLTAWGYADVRGRLLEQLQELAAAHAAAVAAIEAAAGAESGGDTAAAAEQETAIAKYSDHLQAVGLSLAAFATPLACNNPGCGNVAGPSEAELVGGRSCVCGGCLVARYCSRACQRVHWKKQHKPVCKALAAAAGAAGGESM